MQMEGRYSSAVIVGAPAFLIFFLLLINFVLLIINLLICVSRYLLNGWLWSQFCTESSLIRVTFGATVSVTNINNTSAVPVQNLFLRVFLLQNQTSQLSCIAA